MSLHLCDICRGLDIRKLLTTSEAQLSTLVETTLAGLLVEKLEWKTGIPDFFRHQMSFGALEESSKLGCTLCKLIWECCSEGSKKLVGADKVIDDAGHGQLFIGTSRCNVSRGEIPVVTVSQRPEGQSPRTLCTFDIFSEKGALPHKESRYVGMPVAPHSDSEYCKARALEWFQECLANHPLCGSSRSFRQPTRLINVGSKNDDSSPHLEINELPGSALWAALSYCWGGDSDFVLRDDTFRNLKRGIPLGEFPATLRDAIKITRSLGLQYLWIDALCIFQESPTDWHTEASRIRDVYSGAAVTIIAAESPSTASGIYSSRLSTKWTLCQLQWGEETESRVWLRPSFRSAIDPSYTNPIQTRGWTLQEGLLAPRTLSFRKDQMVWECSNYRRTESGHTILLNHMFDGKDHFHNKGRKNRAKILYQDVYFGLCKQMEELKKQKSRIGWLPKYMPSSGLNIRDSLGLNPYTRWSHIVFEYSRRNFTKDIDILPALGGIARAFSDITKDKYYAGMWESEFLQSLCWWRQGLIIDKEKLYEPVNMDLTKPTAYRAPSWSWASINGGRVAMHNNVISNTIPIQNIATPIKVYLEPVGKDPFGQLRSGYLRIKGSMFELGDLWTEYWRTVSPSWEQFKVMSSKNRAPLSTYLYPSLHAIARQHLNKGNGTFEFEQQYISHVGQRFVAFLIAYTEGLSENDVENEREPMKGAANLLLLESTGIRDDEYRRIGVITLTRPWELSIVDPSIHRIETRKWKEISEDQIGKI